MEGRCHRTRKKVSQHLAGKKLAVMPETQKPSVDRGRSVSRISGDRAGLEKIKKNERQSGEGEGL